MLGIGYVISSFGLVYYGFESGQPLIRKIGLVLLMGFVFVLIVGHIILVLMAIVLSIFE